MLIRFKQQFLTIILLSRCGIMHMYQGLHNNNIILTPFPSIAKIILSSSGKNLFFWTAWSINHILIGLPFDVS
jgi:hypothetical protein